MQKCTRVSCAWRLRVVAVEAYLRRARNPNSRMNFPQIPHQRVSWSSPESRFLGWELGALGGSRDLSDPRRGSGSSWRSSREVFFSLRRLREGRGGQARGEEEEEEGREGR